MRQIILIAGFFFIICCFNVAYPQDLSPCDSIPIKMLPKNDTVHFCIETCWFYYDYIKVCVNGIVQYDGEVCHDMNHDNVPKEKFTGYNSQIYNIFFNIVTTTDTLKISFTYIEKNRSRYNKTPKYFTPKVFNLTVIPKSDGKYILLGLRQTKDSDDDTFLHTMSHCCPFGAALKNGFMFD